MGIGMNPNEKAFSDCDSENITLVCDGGFTDGPSAWRRDANSKTVVPASTMARAEKYPPNGLVAATRGARYMRLMARKTPRLPQEALRTSKPRITPTLRGEQSSIMRGVSFQSLPPINLDSSS